MLEPDGSLKRRVSKALKSISDIYAPDLSKPPPFCLGSPVLVNFSESAFCNTSHFQLSLGNALLMFMIFSSLIWPNFFPILFRLAPLTILGAIMFKMSSPCLFLVEAVSFGVVHFLSLAVIYVFEFGLFFFGGESSAVALRTFI
jgi:hypothetical protein